jgi:Icc-related predicted phosphoesterase
MHLQRPVHSDGNLLTFAVVADTHINEVEFGGSSPFVTNAYANARARYVFDQISQIQDQIDFVVHLGDIVHPVPGLEGFLPAVANFKELTRTLKVPIYLVPGNHDIGDKKVDWMPADQITSHYIEVYRKQFGPDWFVVERGEFAFFFINTVLINSGLKEEQVQKNWLESETKRLAGKRQFFFMHYPPYLTTPLEPGSYDNVDRPGRDWLLERLSARPVEGIFCGHVHNYWCSTLGHALYYLLPSTAFMRHDFSVFYKVAPQEEFGRGDPGRFGFFLVDVNVDGHVAYSIRTGARMIAPDETDKSFRSERTFLAHPEFSQFSCVGLELRQPWAYLEQVPATGGVQEIGRKVARNDYPFQSLVEMGVKLVLVPEIDLREAVSAERLRFLKQFKVDIYTTKIGSPSSVGTYKNDPVLKGLICNQLISAFESEQSSYIDFRRDTKLEVYLAPVHGPSTTHITSSDSPKGKFTHSVKTGFKVSELESHTRFFERCSRDGALDGIVVRAEFDEPISRAVEASLNAANQSGLKILLSVKTGGKSVAEANNNPYQLTWLTVSCLFFSNAYQGKLKFIFDNFLDIDRGYYPRGGFVSGHYDLRPAGVAWRQITALYSSWDFTITFGSSGDDWLIFEASTFHIGLARSEKAFNASPIASWKIKDQLILGFDPSQHQADSQGQLDLAELPRLVVGA